MQYIPRRTHKILDLIGPTPHKYLFVETEFSWCLKLCYYILTTYIHILQYISKFRVCAIWISTGNYYMKHSKRHNHASKFTKYVMTYHIVFWAKNNWMSIHVLLYFVKKSYTNIIIWTIVPNLNLYSSILQYIKCIHVLLCEYNKVWHFFLQPPASLCVRPFFDFTITRFVLMGTHPFYLEPCFMSLYYMYMYTHRITIKFLHYTFSFKALWTLFVRGENCLPSVVLAENFPHVVNENSPKIQIMFK